MQYTNNNTNFVFKRNKMVCIQVKVLDSNFQLISKMLYIFTFWYLLGRNVKHGQFSRAGIKVRKFQVLTKKCVICEKVWQIVKINTNLKLSCAFVNERTQHILHPCESLCKWISIDIKYIDITQNLITQWAILWDMVNFPEPEEKRANFTSKQKHVICSHNSFFLFQICLF